jgi:uncharacterized protein
MQNLFKITTDVVMPPIMNRGFTIVKDSPVHGKGLFAKTDIPKGTRIIAYEGERVLKDQLGEDYLNGLSSLNYVMNLNETMAIDGERNGNDARFINHSCEPNCVVYFLNETPFIYANQLIQKDEELSFDYQMSIAQNTEQLTTKQKVEMLPCVCGKANCRKTLIAL